MSQSSNLPTEILCMIFKNVRDRDNCTYGLVPCMLTCKNWNRIGVELLYSRILIDGYGKDALLLLSLSEDKTGKGKLVKKIIDQTIDPFYKEPNELMILFSELFPCLEEYDMQRYPHRDMFMAFYRCILKGGFRCLKSVPVTNNLFGSTYLTRCLVAVKDTITSINLERNGEGYVDTYAELGMDLTQFTKLKIVDIRIKCCFKAMECGIIEYVESISLQANQRMNLKIEIGESTVLLSNNSDINSVNPMNNVDSLSILSEDESLFRKNDAFLLHLIKRFPSLHELTMVSKLPGPLIDQTLLPKTFASLEVTIQFTEYLFKIPKCSVKFIPINRLRAADYFSVLNNIPIPYFQNCFEIKYVTQMNYQLRPVTTTSDEYYLHFKQNNFTKLRKFIVAYEREDANPKSNKHEYRALIKTVGRYLQKLRLTSIITKHIFVLMEDMTNYCPHLNGLMINDLLEENGDKCVKFTTAPSPYPSMTSLEFSRCNVSQQLIDYIALKFPCLESLAFCESTNFGKGSHLSIVMKDVSLRSINFNFGYPGNECSHKILKRNFVFVKVMSDTKTERDRYFCLDCDVKPINQYQHVSNPSQLMNFDECIKDKKCLTILVHCKSVKNFIAEYDTGCSEVYIYVD